MATFAPPNTNSYSPVPPPGSASLAMRRLLRHYGSQPQGTNVYYLTDGTVTETDPDGTTVTWDDVRTVWWGGHEAVEITSAERSALIAAGYSVTD